MRRQNGQDAIEVAGSVGRDGHIVARDLAHKLAGRVDQAQAQAGAADINGEYGIC